MFAVARTLSTALECARPRAQHRRRFTWPSLKADALRASEVAAPEDGRTPGPLHLRSFKTFTLLPPREERGLINKHKLIGVEQHVTEIDQRGGVRWIETLWQ